MFSSANIECDPVPVLAAKHAMSIVRAMSPFQRDIVENRTQLMLFSAAAVGAAILIELAFAVAEIIRQRGVQKAARR